LMTRLARPFDITRVERRPWGHIEKSSSVITPKYLKQRASDMSSPGN
jgi:hypothetical protein